VEVRVQAFFLLLPFVAVLTGLSEGGAGVAIRLTLLGVLVGAVLAHEIGHVVCARARGVRVGHVGLGFLGGVAWIG
jgi:Zn-dependent protease with chaperone function